MPVWGSNTELHGIRQTSEPRPQPYTVLTLNLCRKNSQQVTTAFNPEFWMCQASRMPPPLAIISISGVGGGGEGM